MKDIDSVTWYYKLQASTASPPAKPTTATPSGWTTTEPTYTAGSTNSLYVCQKTAFSDGTFEYSNVSLSSSYEAAKAAYNRALATSNEIQAVNQYFWHTSTGDDKGAHITEVSQADWGDSSSQYYHSGGNLLATSDGILVRDGLTTLASFGSSTAIGKDGDGRLTLDSSKIQMIAPDESVVFDIRNRLVYRTQLLDTKKYDGSASSATITLQYPITSVVTISNPTINDIETTHYTTSESIRGGLKEVTYTFDENYLTIGDEIRVSWNSAGYVSDYTLGLRDGDPPLNPNWTTVIGFANKAEGAGAVATGVQTNAKGYASHTEGWLTDANAAYSHAEGCSTTASNEAAHTEGWLTYALGSCSHSEGQASRATASFTHAEGYSTKASGVASHAEGYVTTANAQYSHAEGNHTTAGGTSAHSEGGHTTASGTSAHAEGDYCVASGGRSHAGGYYTVAASANQTVIGKYNIEDRAETYAFIIGNGTADNSRTNAQAITWDGDMLFALDTSASTGTTDGDLYAAITTLGWQSEVIV